MKKRYFIYIAFKGTAYHGWQQQPNGISVQEVLTKAMNMILRSKINLVGAGRTDAGVHAKSMVAHFDYEETINEQSFLSQLNCVLPKDIAVFKLIEVNPTAHARFDAIFRKYEYHVVTQKNVFKTDTTLLINKKMDFQLINEAAQLLKEYNDFTSFSKLHTNVKTNYCTIYQAEWQQQDEEWIFTIEANRFLRNMVRSIVGTLFEIGFKKINIEQFKEIIEAKNRCKAGMSVPAKGLFLSEIKYPENIFVLEND